MDRLLRHELDAVAADRRSGAAELTLRAVTALHAWLRRHRQPRERELLEIARTLLRAQPSMAPLLRLANEVALATDHALPAQPLIRSLGSFRSLLRRGPNRIAGLFYRWLKRRKRYKIGAYSYSSVVTQALLRAHGRIELVCCSEGRPAYEGRWMAERLSRAGIRVQLSPDAAFLEETRFHDLQVSGADAVTPGGFVSKVGTEIIVSQTSRAGRRVIVLAETLKFWPESPLRPTRFWKRNFANPREVWRDAPENVRVTSPLFSCAPFAKHVALLTERGWMIPARVRREVEKIKISPRLKDLAN
jgi:translation initiation factor 2B subunit (eIF-2B alpha/beta/delta family)